VTTSDLPDDGDTSVVRSEEQLHVGTRLQDAGRLLVRKFVGERNDSQDVERSSEQMEVETTPAEDGDSGEVITLPDGSLSIPLFEERIVVEKRMFVRERMIVRKFSVAHQERVSADVRFEQVEVVPDAEVSDRIEAGPDAVGLVRSVATPPVAPPADAPADAPATPTTRASRDPKARRQS
jgi:uncharacterized protein (TIGR02271 family)